MSTVELIASIALGLIVGSFLSMLIPRLHEDKKGIVAGRSECPHCRHTLGIFDLIPVLSYLFLRGRCRYCKKSIAAWYPFTELATALLFGALFLHLQNWVTFLSLAPLFAILVFIFFYDLRYKEIHDAVMAPGIVYAFITTLTLGDWKNSLVGACIGVVFFGIQYLLSRGRWVGSGDLRIGAFIGIILGWEGILLSLFLSYVFGSIIGIVLLLTKKATQQTAVPLGPFLVLGTLLSFFWGDRILDFYFSLSSL
jgi:prepilin signal peptidase PulO-like enzyme (type II secretory pathway)